MHFPVSHSPTAMHGFDVCGGSIFQLVNMPIAKNLDTKLLDTGVRMQISSCMIRTHCIDLLRTLYSYYLFVKISMLTAPSRNNRMPQKSCSQSSLIHISFKPAE